MANTDLTRDLYAHLLRADRSVPAGLITAASAHAPGHETLTLVLLRHPDTPTALAKKLAGPAKRRTANVWVAYLGRAEHSDDDRVAAIRDETRVKILRAIARDRHTPPAVLTALAASTDDEITHAVLGNRNAPAAARLDILRRVEQHIRNTVGRHTANERLTLDGLNNILRSPAFDDIATAAILQTEHPALLLSLTTLRTPPLDAARHVARHVIINPLAALSDARTYARADVIDEAETATLRVLRDPPDADADSDLRAAVVDAWNTAALTDDEIRRLRRHLARHGILDAPAPDITTCTPAEALKWAAVDPAAATQLADVLFDRLGDNVDAWRTFDTFATTTTSTLDGVLTATTAVVTPPAHHTH